jgi:hypothetical protein
MIESAVWNSIGSASTQQHKGKGSNSVTEEANRNQLLDAYDIGVPNVQWSAEFQPVIGRK